MSFIYVKISLPLRHQRQTPSLAVGYCFVGIDSEMGYFASCKGKEHRILTQKNPTHKNRVFLCLVVGLKQGITSDNPISIIAEMTIYILRKKFGLMDFAPCI